MPLTLMEFCLVFKIVSTLSIPVGGTGKWAIIVFCQIIENFLQSEK